MEYAICHNQQQIYVTMIMVQVYFGQNCIEHSKGFNSIIMQFAIANLGANNCNLVVKNCVNTMYLH